MKVLYLFIFVYNFYIFFLSGVSKFFVFWYISCAQRWKEILILVLAYFDYIYSLLSLLPTSPLMLASAYVIT